MDGQSRVQKQLQAGIRDCILFVDHLRLKYGMDKIVSTTPKVETRLRKGEDTNKDLKVEYRAEKYDVTIVLCINRNYPETPLFIQIYCNDYTEKENEKIDALVEEGETEEEKPASMDRGEVFTSNLIVLQAYLQNYCDHLHKDYLHLKVDHSDGEGDGFSTRQSETTTSFMMGIEVIDRFLASLEEHFPMSTNSKFSGNKALKLNAIGEIDASIFQFDSLQQQLDALGDSGENDSMGNDSVDNDSVESENESENDSENISIDDVLETNLILKSSPTAIYKCQKCRNNLFRFDDLDEHSSKSESRRILNHVDSCTSLFLSDAPPFDTGQSTDNAEIGLMLKADTGSGESAHEGKVVCNKCGMRVGTWSWIGIPCSCKEWMVPAFQVIRSKIDTF